MKTWPVVEIFKKNSVNYVSCEWKMFKITKITWLCCIYIMAQFSTLLSNYKNKPDSQSNKMLFIVQKPHKYKNEKHWISYIKTL